MKIALLSTFDQLGGASIAALRLHKGLRLQGHDSWMLVKEKSSQDPYIEQMDLPGRQSSKQEKIFRLIEQQVFAENRTALSNTRFSLPYPGYDLAKSAVVRNADVVNLHWIALFQSIESVAALLAAGKPVVWTLHDMNPFSGGCHYSAGCLGYHSDCRECPQLRENELQLPAKILAAKKKYWQGDLTIVTPSRWLADCARQSALFGKCRIEVIANSLEHEIYRPDDKIIAKKALGLKPDCLYLLFSSFTGHEKRKGFAHLIHALQYCLGQERFRALVEANGIAVITLGPYEAELKNLGMKLHPLGMVADDWQLARIYAAADFMVLPSEEENLPNVMLEAMACATPVVSFAIGGMPDVIANGVNGMLATPGNPENLGAAILSLVFDSNLRKKQGQSGRELIESKFKLGDQSQNYLRLFEELLAAKAASVTLDRKHTPLGTVAIDLLSLFPCSQSRGRSLFQKNRFNGSRLIALWRRKWKRLFYLLRYSGFKSTIRIVIKKLLNRR